MLTHFPPLCKCTHILLHAATNHSFLTDKFSSHPSKVKALVDVSKISLKAFIVLAIFAYYFVHFNQEPWKSTCKVVIESFWNRSYQLLIGEKKQIRSHLKLSNSFMGYHDELHSRASHF